MGHCIIVCNKNALHNAIQEYISTYLEENHGRKIRKILLENIKAIQFLSHVGSI